MTVEADGTYTYTVNDNFRGYGEKDVFNYLVTSPSGNTSEAELTFDLNLTPKDQRIEIDNVVIIDTAPSVTLDTDKSEIKAATGFKLIDLGLLGPILNAEILSNAGAMQFTVGKNEVRELTFHGSAGGVSIGKTFDMVIYKLDPSTGNYVQVHLEKDWFNIILLGGKSDPLTLLFGEGEYRAILNSKGLLGVAEGSGLYVDHDKIYDYGKPTEYAGSVSGDATPDETTILLKVKANGVEVDVKPDSAAEITGKYGVLTINTDGSYTYTVTKPVNAPADWKPAYGQVDSFQLVTQGANGKTVIENLNIKIGTHTAQDDFNTVTVAEHNVESKVEFHDSSTLLNGIGKTYSKEFDIKTNEMGKGFTIKVAGTSESFLGLNKKDMTVSYVLKNTTTGQQWTFTTPKGKDAVLDIGGGNLPAGHYALTVITQDGTIDSIDFVADIVHLDSYTEKLTPIAGKLFENDLGIDSINSLKIGNKELSVSDPNKGVKSFDIKGEFGTLTVFKDGNYSYKPTGGIYGIDHFTYETTSNVGTKETAVLEINVGKNISASEFSDSVKSSAANDTFKMGAGADTVIYDILNKSDANSGGNGGNGLDTWTDFNATEGDKIDISKLLDGNQNANNIGDYVSYEDGVLKIDRNGKADSIGQPEGSSGQSNYVDLININTSSSLEDLLKNNIIWH
nr:BapA/Bap/LapF family large adhesin [Acinetobacter pullicarnis]